MYLQIKIHNSISPSAIPNNIRLTHHTVGITTRIITANNKNTVAAIGIITPKILRFNLYISNNEYVFTIRPPYLYILKVSSYKINYLQKHTLFYPDELYTIV